VCEPRGLDIELSSFEQRAVWIDEAVPVAKKRIADLVAATLAASRMLAEGELALARSTKGSGMKLCHQNIMLRRHITEVEPWLPPKMAEELHGQRDAHGSLEVVKRP
jgi:hypothetical protein